MLLFVPNWACCHLVDSHERAEGGTLLLTMPFDLKVICSTIYDVVLPHVGCSGNQVDVVATVRVPDTEAITETASAPSVAAPSVVDTGSASPELPLPKRARSSPMPDLADADDTIEDAIRVYIGQVIHNLDSTTMKDLYKGVRVLYGRPHVQEKVQISSGQGRG